MILAKNIVACQMSKTIDLGEQNWCSLNVFIPHYVS